jgi:hypothetical protein
MKKGLLHFNYKQDQQFLCEKIEPMEALHPTVPDDDALSLGKVSSDDRGPSNPGGTVWVATTQAPILQHPAGATAEEKKDDLDEKIEPGSSKKKTVGSFFMDQTKSTKRLLSAAALSSGASNLPALHHSITSCEIRCTWGWQMWALVVLGVVPLTCGLIVAHFVYAYRRGFGMRKLVELFLSLTLFLAPYASSSFFHLHHW